jgi:hypothetical protein
MNNYKELIWCYSSMTTTMNSGIGIKAERDLHDDMQNEESPYWNNLVDILCFYL